jgi:hypothetical protein
MFINWDFKIENVAFTTKQLAVRSYGGQRSMINVDMEMRRQMLQWIFHWN